MSNKIIEIRTPDLGDTEKIELIKWYKEEGMNIEIGDEVLELVTDKAAFPVESPIKGKLISKKVESGSIVLKNQILGVMEIA